MILSDLWYMDMRRKLLLPGQYYVTDSPMILETIVGSCVAVCLFNRKNSFAAMNHFLLDAPSNPHEMDIGRYGTTSTEYILNKLFAMDPHPTHYQGQIFGGAAVLKNSAADDVGERNIAIAMEILAARHIKVIHSEIGGSRGRRIKFNTVSNTVDCRFTGDIPRKNKTQASG